MAIIIFLFSLYFFWAIKDPDMDKLHRVSSVLEKNQEVVQTTTNIEEFTLGEKISEFNRLVKKELSDKPILLSCLIGAAIAKLFAVLFSTYLILWIQSFDGFDKGDEAKNIYFNMMIFSVIVGTIVLPVLGKYIDNVPCIKIAPYAFLVRCFLTYLFTFLQQPDSHLAYVTCVLMITATIFESNMMDSIFAKTVNKETRGMLFGLQMFIYTCVMLVYSLVAGFMVD
jgi:magnesium-transporting ATPase (P-type)